MIPPRRLAGADNQLGGTTMENEAAEQNAAGIAAPQLMIGMSDNAPQLREPPLSGIFRQAWDARFGHRTATTWR
jgi:hypothetical protein